jgi:hypothetical protein
MIHIRGSVEAEVKSYQKVSPQLFGQVQNLEENCEYAAFLIQRH